MIDIKRGLKNTFYLTAGKYLSQIISFLGIIFIARILGTENYGIYVTVGVFVRFFEFFQMRGFNRVIVREGCKDIAQLAVYLEKTIFTRRILGILTVGICLIFLPFTNYEPLTRIYIIIASIQLAFTAYGGYIRTIFITHQKMEYIAAFDIIKTLLYVAFAIIFLLCGFGILALILVGLIMELVILFASYHISRNYVHFNPFAKICFDKKILKPALTFSLLMAVGFLATRIDLLMISFLGKDSSDVGIYGIAYKFADQLVILSSAFTTAFLPLFINKFHNDKVKSSWLLKNSILFFLAILALTAVVSLLCKPMIVFMLGREYAESGYILSILIYYASIWWATLPYSLAAQATHNEKYILVARIVMAAMNIPLNYILFLRFGIIGIAYSTLIVYSAGSLLMIFFIHGAMKRQGYIIT